MSYVYKLTHKSGLFYIGKRTGDSTFDLDFYWGSGTLLHDCYKLQGFYTKYLHPAVAPFDWEKECLHDNAGADVGTLEAAAIKIAVSAHPEACLNLTHRSGQAHPERDALLTDFAAAYCNVKKHHQRIYHAASLVAFATAGKLFDNPSEDVVRAAVAHLYPHITI